MTLLLTLLASLSPGLAHADPPSQCTPAEYLAQRPDVAAAHMDALTHYNYSGRTEGMCYPVLTNRAPASPPPPPGANREICTPEEYLRRRPDVSAARIGPATHYNRYGRAEGMCSPTDPTLPPGTTQCQVYIGGNRSCY